MDTILKDIPIPLMLLLGFVALVVTLIACAPSAWIGKAEEEMRKRRERDASQR